MSHINTGGRRGIAAAAFIAAIVTISACGTQTATDPGSAVPDSAPKVSQTSAATSADAAERRGRQQGSATSADATERRGQQDVKPAPAGKRVPD